VSLVFLGLLASLGAGLLTAVGAIPVLVGRKVSRRVNDAMLGFAAGVMLAASFFSLILPALEGSTALYGAGFVPAASVTMGILLGGLVVGFMNEVVPHEHFLQGREGPEGSELDRVWLFVLAITIHNLPEGLAVGVGFGGGDIVAGTMLAVGIGLQNAPEGLAVGLALRAVGYPPRQAFAIAALTGLVEPITGGLGAWAVSFSVTILPLAMSFAAGAMIYVISHEIIPETHRHGAQRLSTFGLMIGFAVMMLLDTSFR
jgi:zinc transporter, ZIP family